MSYEHLQVFQTTQRFIESSAPPADGTMVDTTWLYVNKGGGPDRRFNNNRQLPVMLYGRVVFTTSAGLYWILQISRHQAAEPVAQMISLGSKYTSQIRRTQERAASDLTTDHQVAARADQQNAMFLKSDDRGIYGQYPPAHLDDGAKGRGQARARLELVTRTGKPRLWREHPDGDAVMIQVDIRPVVPDTRWWSCFAQVTAERQMHVKLGAVSRGGIAMRAENPAGVPAIIAAIDDAIDTANHQFINTCAKDEVETYVDQLRSAKSADAKARFDLDLESLSELLAKDSPD